MSVYVFFTWSFLERLVSKKRNYGKSFLAHQKYTLALLGFIYGRAAEIRFKPRREGENYLSQFARLAARLTSIAELIYGRENPLAPGVGKILIVQHHAHYNLLVLALLNMS